MPSPMSGTPPRRSPISPIVPSKPAPASWRFTKTPPSAAMVLRTTTPAMIARITTVRAAASATIWRARRGAKSAYQFMRRAWRMRGGFRARAEDSCTTGGSGCGAHAVEEALVEAVLARHLGVERRAHQVALLDGHDPAVVERGQHRRIRPDRLDDRRADEHRVHRGLPQLRDVEIGLERVVLVAEGVASHRDVEPAEALLPFDGIEHRVGEQDQPGARAVHRHTARDAAEQGLGDAEGAAQLVDHTRLTARDHEPRNGLELLGTTNRHRIRAQLTQHREVLAHVALQREDADPRRVTSHARRDGAAPPGRTR